jgi:hypothetical protein
MVMQIDDKGKIFTQVITKNPHSVVIQTTRQMIHGTIHVRPTERVMDEINNSEKFIAVTDATVTDLNGNLLYESSFLTLNRDQIIWLIPLDDTAPKKDLP